MCCASLRVRVLLYSGMDRLSLLDLGQNSILASSIELTHPETPHDVPYSNSPRPLRGSSSAVITVVFYGPCSSSKANIGPACSSIAVGGLGLGSTTAE